MRWRHCPSCHRVTWSVSQNPETGAWHCYACEAGSAGNKVQGVDKILSLLKPSDPLEWPEMELPPFEPLSPTARRYLKRRGLTNPEKYGIMEVEDSTRVVFPYRGPYGRTIYYSTRWYEPDGRPKYVVATGVRPLYVLPRWEPSDHVIIVEGIMDAIATHEATGEAVIALGGKSLPTYLRPDMRMLAPSRKTIMLDNDAAGFKAAMRLKGTLRKSTIHMLPVGVDPSQYFNDGGTI